MDYGVFLQNLSSGPAALEAASNMTDFSDPNHRPLRVVTFLAAHATEAFTLAELARLLALSKGSAHRVMMALTEAGFVARHPRHKTYTLGMALVAIGEAALERYPGIAIARREMSRLHAELGVGCGATAIVNDEYLLLGREGTPRTCDGLTLVGERRLVVPSIGIGQIAWRGEDEIAAYMAKGAPYMNAELHDHLVACFPEIRRRGYTMAANGTGIPRLIAATIIPLGQHAGDALPVDVLHGVTEIPPSEFQIRDIVEAAGKGVNYIAAPVFSAEGEVCLEIVISGFPEHLGVQEIERYATKATQAADIVTSEIRGRKPKPW
jgi:DNA-binding IclR family transcriptional regulator